MVRSERHRRFEFVVRTGTGDQWYGHYSREDAERHRQQFGDRLRRSGRRVVELL